MLRRGSRQLCLQDAETVRQRKKTVIWFVWSVSFVWLNKTKSMNQINQIDQMNQTDHKGLGRRAGGR